MAFEFLYSAQWTEYYENTQYVCDYKFKCFDTNGEQPISTMVASVTQEEEGVVAALDEVQL